MTQLIRIGDVLKQTGLSRSLLYRKLDTGDFPKPVKLGERINAWPASEVEDWIAQRVAER